MPEIKKENSREKSQESQIPVGDSSGITPEPEIRIPSISDLQKYFRRTELPEISESTSFHNGSRSGGSGLKLIVWSFAAALIDSLILFSMGCLFLLSFSLLVRSHFGFVLHFFEGSVHQVGLLGALGLIGTYMIMLRVFLGFTIGEWACGLRLGSLKQRLNRFYSLKVVARVSLVLATGLFLLPALSMLTGRDIAGLIVGLPLIQPRK